MREWHIITCEYPPQRGGVGDYTSLLASQLAAQGDAVDVWCGGRAGSEREACGVTVHREFGRFDVADLKRVDRLLSTSPRPRRILLQWVPTGYGKRFMNLAFCRWITRRRKMGDEIELMVHEPYLPFSASIRRNVVACVHRVM